MIMVIVVSLWSLTALLYIVSSSFLPESYSNIEHASVLKDLYRASDAIYNIFPQLHEKLSDWSAWDDSYEFILDHNEDYIDSNLGTESILNIKINAMVFANATGDVLFRKAVDANTEEEVDSSEFGSHLEQHRELIIHDDVDDYVFGILSLSTGPFMFVSQPVLTSQGEGPIPGSLTFGKNLNQDIIDSISKLTHLAVQIFPYGDPSSPKDVLEAERGLGADTESVINPISDSSIAAYKLIYDFYGKPILVLKVETTREVYNQGRFTSRFFILAVCVLMIVFGFILVALLERFVVSRFTNLSKRVKEMHKNEDLTLRIKEGSSDEIGELASSINSFLDKIAASVQAEKLSGEKMRVLGEELQKHLEETERLNRFMVNRELRMVELKEEVKRLSETK